MRRNENRRAVNSKKKDVTLLTLLANEATNDAIKLLKRHDNKAKVLDHEDLEVKLAKLYTEAPDKVALEKEMAQIHPHKKWILKYASVVPQVSETTVNEKIKEEVKKPVAFKEEEAIVAHDGYSDMSGTKCNCGCHKTSSAEGSYQQPTISANTNNNNLLALFGLGIVAIAVTGIVIYSKKQ